MSSLVWIKDREFELSRRPAKLAGYFNVYLKSPKYCKRGKEAYVVIVCKVLVCMWIGDESRRLKGRHIPLTSGIVWG